MNCTLTYFQLLIHLKYFSFPFYSFNSVVSFAGDALICVFTPATDPPKFGDPYCARALRCAYALRKVHNSGLSTHIAISCGKITLAVLGGYRDEWTFILNGECLNEMSCCINLADKEEVVVSRPFYELVRHTPNTVVQGKIMKSAHECLLILSINDVPLDDSNETDRTSVLEDNKSLQDAAECFVPFPALAAIYAGTLDYVARLQKITTMFLLLDSYSTIKHRDPKSLQSFFYLLQEVSFGQ